MSIVSTEWLASNFEKVKILDCSWHLPNVSRNSKKEFDNDHLENAIFFDLDDNSDKKSDLPHMMPSKKIWEEIVSSMGISNNDEIVIYDNSDLYSSCRCWFSFIYFGHNPNLVHVLDGGLKKWKLEKRSTTSKINKVNKTKYIALEKKEMIKNKKQIDENIKNKKFKVIDARSKRRFEGKDPEPRKDVKSGSIKNSYCLPFNELITENHTFKNSKDILNKFSSLLGSSYDEEIVFSCGSGVTATVLALAYSMINNKYTPTIYDGSWAEYGKLKL